MSASRRPTLHVIAGPNGSGKTTLYYTSIKPRYPNVEFVNADQLAEQRFGHPARTPHESAVGQQLAEERRKELMADRKNLATESTFSHPSKLDLVREAKAAGYSVYLYHVNVRSPELSVLRVQDRVERGGHPVPEDRIRGRYERNQPLIREAAKLADRAYIFDNSKRDQPHTLTAELRHGRVISISENVPAWARSLYAEELKQFSPARQNRPAASFAQARAMTRSELGEEANTFIARPNARFRGPIIGETDLHVLQRVGDRSAVAHFTSKFGQVPAMGAEVTVRYDSRGRASVEQPERTAAQQPHGAGERAAAYRTLSKDEALKRHPELAAAYRAEEQAKARFARVMPGAKDEQLQEIARKSIAERLEKGELSDARKPPARDQVRAKGRTAQGMEPE